MSVIKSCQKCGEQFSVEESLAAKSELCATCVGLAQPAVSGAEDNQFAGLASLNVGPPTSFSPDMFAIKASPPPPTLLESSPVLNSTRRIIGAVAFICGPFLLIASFAAAMTDPVLAMPFVFSGYLALLGGACLVAFPAVAEGMIRGLKRKLSRTRTPPTRKDVDRVIYMVPFVMLVLVLSAIHYVTFFSNMR
jgi:hypothetical protein